jgi:hypothetical protein
VKPHDYILFPAFIHLLIAAIEFFFGIFGPSNPAIFYFWLISVGSLSLLGWFFERQKIRKKAEAD